MSEPTRGAGVRRRPSALRPLWIAATIFAVSLGILLLGDRWISRRAETRGALPTLSGTLRVSGLRMPVDVSRNARGVPVLRATSEPDAWYALGFVHAQDRLGQMLWMRRMARGRAAEIAGTVALPSDRLARTLGIGRAADAEVQRLDASLRGLLEAYASGVNAQLARIESGRVRPPVSTAGWPPPEPWRAADSIALSKLVAWGTGASLDSGLVLSDLVERLGGLGSRLFFPAAGAIAGVAGAVDPRRADDSAGGPDRGSGAPLAEFALGGSAWVVAGELAASHAPLLAAQLTAAPTAPSLFYEVVLHGGALHAAGVTTPGIPVLWAGRNRDVAWAAVPARAANVDWRMETLHPTDPSLYHNGGRWTPIRERRETILVRSEPDGSRRSQSLTIRSTHHGPLLNPLLRTKREPLALAWTGALPGEGISGLAGAARAGNGEELVAALERHHEPILAVVYADRFGAGGVQVAGWIPRRVLPTSLLPVPGRMRAFDWKEPVPTRLLPSARLSEGRAWLVAADSGRPTGSERSPVEWLWRSGRRAGRIESLLADAAASDRIDAAVLARILSDPGVPAAAELVPPLLAFAGAGPRLGPKAQEIAALLADWEGRASPDSRGAAAYHVFLDHLVHGLFAEAVGEALLERYLALSFTSAELVVAGVVRGAVRPSRGGSASDPRRLGTAARQALQQTWSSLRSHLGPSRERWRWGNLHRLTFRSFQALDPRAPPPEGLPPAIALGGSGETLCACPFDSSRNASGRSYAVRRAALYRLTVDLGDAPGSLSSALAPGQSEHPGSPHRRDGLAAWLEGRSARLELDPERAEASARHRLRLEPGP